MNNQTSTLEKVSFDFPLEILKQTEESGEFHIVGYAATTDFDLQGDIITEEALKDSSLDLLKNSTVLLNHDVTKPIGKVTKAEFDQHGLLIDVLISKTEPDIIQKIKEGVLNKFSIRGQVLEREKKFMPEYNREVNVIKRMALVEVSLVSVPANPEAKAIGWYVSKALRDVDEQQKGEQTVTDKEKQTQEISPKGDSIPPEEGAEQEKKGTPDAPNPQEPPAEMSKAKPPKAKPKDDSMKASDKSDPKGTKKGDDGEEELSAIWILLDVLAGMGPNVAPIAIQLKSLIEQMMEEEEADESDDASAASGDTSKTSPSPTMKSKESLSKEDLSGLIASEVKKQVESALSHIPAMRKGLIQPEPEADELKKTFETLPPEKKLKVALALHH